MADIVQFPAPVGGPDVNATLPEVVVTAKRDPPPASKLFGRMWSLILAGPPGSAPEEHSEQRTVGKDEAKTASLSDFHIEFEIESQMLMVPWKLTATVYNVPDDLAKQIADEYTEVTLYGGYQHARYGQLFTGQIIYFEKGKLSPVDTFLRIHAATKDQAINQEMVNKRLPAGSTGQDIINAVLAVMAPYGVTAGTITQLSAVQDQKSTRSRTLYGLPAEILRDLTQAIDGFCFIDQTGKLHVLGPNESLPPAPIDINILNGMVNIPTQHMGAAITVQCLLNYQITPGCQIRLNNDEVNKFIMAQGAETSLDLDSVYKLQTTSHIESDGIYCAWTVTHRGDNRGQSWYTEVVTKPLNPDQAGPRVG